MQDNNKNQTLKKHILVIDDEPEVLSLLKEFLEEKEFKVSTAADGIRAMESLEQNLPHLVICDLLLPGEHGINLVKTIKEKYFIPIIIISSIYPKEDLSDFMEEHFVESFMEKPLDLGHLFKQIQGILKC